MAVPFQLVNELAKVAEALLKLAIKHGNDKVILHVKEMRIEIRPDKRDEEKNEI